jgi:CDGSH-type Zn-finger protein
MDDTSKPTISIAPNGPLRVEGGLPLSRQRIETNDEGEPWDWREIERIDAGESYALCRCDRSGAQPFCDDTCSATGWDGTETASDVPYEDQARIFPGPELDLADAIGFCASARFCDARGSVWTLVREADPQAREVLVRQAGHCPSGRLVALARGAGGSGTSIEPVFEPSVVLVEDGPRGISGPVWVRGGVEIRSGDGHAYEVRNRVTLCRCGRSANKPFCDGSHVSAARAGRAPG